MSEDSTKTISFKVVDDNTGTRESLDPGIYYLQGDDGTGHTIWLERGAKAVPTTDASSRFTINAYKLRGVTLDTSKPFTSIRPGEVKENKQRFPLESVTFTVNVSEVEGSFSLYSALEDYNKLDIGE
jgi:hypothetical protein